MAGRRWGSLALAGVVLACGASPTPAGPLPEADLRVLFVGNSLTYVNDLPRLVASLADATGHTLSWAVSAEPDFSLEEHAAAGIASRIRTLRPDVVVLQQGPSSIPESREHLERWARALAEPIREAGGRPALLMVWPPASRAHAWDDVRTSYLEAARAVDGLFLPAGEAWREVARALPGARLYGPDGFHPSALGSSVAALAVFEVLFGRAAPTSAAAGLPGVEAAGADEVLLAVRRAVEAWALR